MIQLRHQVNRLNGSHALDECLLNATVLKNTRVKVKVGGSMNLNLGALSGVRSLHKQSTHQRRCSIMAYQWRGLTAQVLIRQRKNTTYSLPPPPEKAEP